VPATRTPSTDALATAAIAILMADMGHLVSDVITGPDDMLRRCLGCAAGDTGRLPAHHLRILDRARGVFQMHHESFRHTQRPPPTAPQANLLDGTIGSIDAAVRRRFSLILELAEQLEQRDWLPGAELSRMLVGE